MPWRRQSSAAATKGRFRARCWSRFVSKGAYSLGPSLTASYMLSCRCLKNNEKFKIKCRIMILRSQFLKSKMCVTLYRWPCSCSV
jgi:hypothetical protein